MTHHHSLISALLAASMLSACAVGSASMVAQEPRPNINLDYGRQKLTLELSEAVADSFKQAGTGTMAGVEVTGWRTTLRNGFRNGFSDALPPTGDKADLTIQLLVAEMSVVPVAVTANGNAAAAAAQIRYKANLLDASGQILKRAAGTSSSKRAVGSKQELGVAASSAVETMFEELATQFFAAE